MKIGVVCPYDLLAPGGVQQLAIELVRELGRGGDEALLVGVGKAADQGRGRDENTVMAGRPLPVRANDSVVPLTLSPLAWGRVREALAGVDVVHVHEPLVPLVGWAGMSVDRPMVATFHADPPSWVPRLYRLAPLVGRRLRKAEITAVSETAAEALPHRWGPVAVIPNAIDVGSYAPPVGRVGHRVCFLGRDEPRKGLDILLEAWTEVRRRVPSAELKVMGADRAGVIPGVEFLGRVSGGEKGRVLASSLVYVAPNTGGESFGMVIAEAMAAGCAVVCSDLSAFRAVAGDHARFVPVGDAGALAEQVVSLLVDPAAAAALGEKAREQVQQFDWSVVAGRYREAYRRALE